MLIGYQGLKHFYFNPISVTLNKKAMKRNLIIVLLFFAVLNLYAQDNSFEFTATMQADVQMGKDWDFSYSELSNNINVVFKNNKLSMIYSTGKSYWDVAITKIVKTKETYESGELKNRQLVLEYQNDENFKGYIIYEYTSDSMSKSHELKLPVILSGWVFKYNYFRNAY